MSAPKNPPLLECNSWSKDDGGPLAAHFSQITLRDLFATAALVALGSADSSDDRIARGCYSLADAMLAAREETSGALWRRHARDA